MMSTVGALAGVMVDSHRTNSGDGATSGQNRPRYGAKRSGTRAALWWTIPGTMISANATRQSGDHLRAARKAAGLSQQRVAELAGCSVSYVRVLESGYRPEHDSDVLVRIAGVLNDESPAGEPGSREISAGLGRHGSG